MGPRPRAARRGAHRSGSHRGRRPRHPARAARRAADLPRRPRTKPTGLAGADFAEQESARILHTIDRARLDHLPKEQAAALRARLDLDTIEPGLRETLAGLRREVDGSADGSNGLRSAIAARLAGQNAGALPTA